MRIVVSTLLLAASVLSAAELTPAEKKAGWRSLFDGKTYKNWVDPSKKTPPGDAWTIEDGCLKTRPNPRITEDLFSVGKYGNFELEWDWKIAPGGNSGLKYLIQDTVFLDGSKAQKGVKFEQTVGDQMEKHTGSRATLPSTAKAQDYVIGLEYQMIDNKTHRDAQRGGKYQTGALYDMIPPSEDASKPVGEFNHSRLVVRGTHIEHWLNGKKVVDSEIDTPETKASMEKRWTPAPQLLKLLSERPHKLCPISLQNHGDEAWFKNIKIRPL